MEHKIAYTHKGVFAGWPANNGVWSWDGWEILVGCSTGELLVQPGHNITGRIDSILLRSRDGGETWDAERPENYVGDGGDLIEVEQPFDFSHPDLALRVIGRGYHGCDEPRGGFYGSTDRGRTWSGPYRFSGLEGAAELRGLELTPRTDYLLPGPGECMVFLSARDPQRWGSDKVFCAQSGDGGLTFHWTAWVTPPEDPFRGVMPATVRCDAQELVSAVRRRSMNSDGGCWIDTFASSNHGRDWAFRSRVGETGAENGNPPALSRLTDGRLCCVYGCRTRKQMLARFSPDNGKTWEDEMILREDFSGLDQDADFGYPRLVQRADGQMVAIYYWATAEVPQQHIAVTIFQAT